METEVELPDGRKILLEHEGELTEDAIKKVASQMGYDVPSSKKELALDLTGEGTRIAGAVAGALKGAKKGPWGAAIGGAAGALLAEPVARAITPREETMGESIANVGLAAVQPANKAGNLVTRLMRGAMIGGPLAGAHKLVQTGIDDQRIASLSELAPSVAVGAGFGGVLEGALGQRLAQRVAPAVEPAVAKEGSITASLDKRKPASLEQANAEANAIALGKPANAAASAQVTPSPVPQAATTVPEGMHAAKVEVIVQKTMEGNTKWTPEELQFRQDPANAKAIESRLKEEAALAAKKPKRASLDDIDAMDEAAAAQSKDKKEVKTEAPETIAHAAVRYSDGEIKIGKNHATIIDENPKGDLRGSDDGFVTSTGRYVSREEAMQIAKKSGQVEKDVPRDGLAIELMTDRPFPAPDDAPPVSVFKPADKPIVKSFNTKLTPFEQKVWDMSEAGAGEGTIIKETGKSEGAVTRAYGRALEKKREVDALAKRADPNPVVAPKVEAPKTAKKPSKKLDIVPEDERNIAAESQRGHPENVMLSVQSKLTSLGMNGLADWIEHIGDISHRLQQSTNPGSYGKIEKLMRLAHPPKGYMTLEQELEQQVKSATEYNVIKKYPELSDTTPRWKGYEQLRAEHADELAAEQARILKEVKPLMAEYAAAHASENKAVTHAGELAKKAAIELGNLDFKALRKTATELSEFYEKNKDKPALFRRSASSKPVVTPKVVAPESPAAKPAAKPVPEPVKTPVATETQIVPEKPVKALETPVEAPTAEPLLPPKPPAAATPTPPPVPPKPTAVGSSGDEAEKAMRKPIKRELSDDSNPLAYKNMLRDDPDAYYVRQKHRAWLDKAEASTDDQLRTLIDEAETGAEKSVYMNTLSNRLVQQGELAEAHALKIAASKMGTPAGQMLHAMGMVRTAFGDLADAEHLAAKIGRNLTKEQKEKVLRMSSDEIGAQELKNVAEKKAKEYPTEANYDAYRKAELAHVEAKHAFDEYTAAIAPRELDELIVKMIQGNLLTPLSIASNVFGNMIWSPVEKASLSLASGFDALMTTSIRGLLKSQGKKEEAEAFKRVISAGNPLPSSLELAAMADGVRVASKELLTGPSTDSYIKAEIQRGFRPLRSLIDSFTGENLTRNDAGKINRWDRVKAFMEGTAGVPPEVMFRMLSIGDKPFRRAATVRAMLEQARLKGIKDADLEHFMMFPDAHTKEMVDKATRRSIFAEENAGITTLNRFLDNDMAKLLRVDKIPVLRGSMKIFGRLTVPFRQFPVNYALTALNFASPPLALAKAAYYIGYKAFADAGRKNMTPKQLTSLIMENRRKGLINLSEAVIGATMYMAADILWENGLISESVADTAAKRSDQTEAMGASKLNKTGLDRYLRGEDPSYRKGDELVDWTRAGIPAVIFHIHTQQKAKQLAKEGAIGDTDKKTRSTGLAAIAEGAIASAPGLGSFIFDQSFLAGTSSLLEAIKDADPESPKFQNWVGNMFKAVSSIAVPNTVDAVARAQMEYVPELRGSNIGENLANVWRHKTFSLPEEDRAMIFKRDTWGRKIPRTPAGADPYIYGLIDVFKGGKQLENRHDQVLYDLYQETGRASVYPDPVGRSVQFQGDPYELDPEDVEKMQETIGTLRRERMEQFVDSSLFNRLDPNERVMGLEQIYQGANTDGREEFITSSGIYQKYFSSNPEKSTVTSRSTESLLRR